MNPSLLGVRRMHNKPLPTLIQKKLKIDWKSKQENNLDEIAKDWPDKYEPYLFKNFYNNILKRYVLMMSRRFD